VEFMKNENIQVEEWNTGVGKPEPGGSKEWKEGELCLAS
jgi:hypothetical protein